MGVGSTFVPTIALSAIILLLQAPPPGSDEGAIFALAGLSNSPEFRKALKEEHDKSRRRVREKNAPLTTATASKEAITQAPQKQMRARLKDGRPELP